MLRVVFCTFPNSDSAASIARTLVAERLVACVNVLPAVRSVYRWQGEICEEAEVLAILKTREARYPAFETRLSELHPYDTPEIVGLSADDCLPDYLSWVVKETASDALG